MREALVVAAVCLMLSGCAAAGKGTARMDEEREGRL